MTGDDPRLAINQAAELIDPAWIEAVNLEWRQRERVAQAERILADCKADLRNAQRHMETHYARLGADNAVPGRSVPNLIAAAQRELGIGRFANGART